MTDDSSKEIGELKQRVNTLTTAVIVLAVSQCLILGILPFALIAFLVALPILAFTHEYLPGFAKAIGRCCSWIFSTGRTFSSHGEHFAS